LELIALAVWFVNTNKLDSEKILTYNPLRIIRKYIVRPDLKYWMLSMMAIGVGGFVIFGSQSLYMSNVFGTSGSTYGYYLSFMGVLTAINMAILVPRVWMKKLHTSHILIINFLALIIGYSIMGIIQQELLYVMAFYVTIILSGAWGIVYNIRILEHATPNETGELSGMMGSMQSLYMIV
jgi:hypothetical protein